MLVILLLLISIGTAFWARQLARARHRSPALWTMLGFVGGIITVVIISLLPDAVEQEAK